VSDAHVVLGAVAVAVAAWLGAALPTPVVAAAVVMAVLRRRPLTVLVALVAVTGLRSGDARSALESPLPARVAGTAQLVSDPRPGDHGSTVELRVSGRRYQAQVDRSDEWVLRPLLSGEHVEVVGRPRPFRGAPVGWQRSRHLAGRLVVTHIERGPPAAPWFALANAVHRRLAAGVGSFDERARSLYLGLVVGDDRAQDDLARFRFQATGLGHLLAVSGQNVAFVLLLVRPVASRVPLRVRWILGAGALVAFVLVTRAEASVLRAAAMALVALLAATSGRVTSGARMLALAVGALVLVDPLVVSGLGFQLSVAATVGLLVGVGPLVERVRGPRWFSEAVATTVSAQLATAPLLMGLNGGVPSVATLTNVLAVPAAGAVMVLGLTAGVVAGFVVDPAAAVLTAPARLLVGWIDGVAEVGSHSPLPLLGPLRLAALIVAAVLVARRRGPTTSAVTWARAVAAVVLVAVALWPVRAPSSATRVSPGVLVGDTVCGRTVQLEGNPDVSDTLAALQRAGVIHADVVVGVSARAVVPVATQLRADVAIGDDRGCRVA